MYMVWGLMMEVGEGLGGRGPEGLAEALGPHAWGAMDGSPQGGCGWEELAWDHVPPMGSSPRFSLYLLPTFTHSREPQACRSTEPSPSGIMGHEHPRVGTGHLQAAVPSTLARGERKQTGSHQGRVLRLALGLLSGTVEPALRVAK